MKKNTQFILLLVSSVLTSGAVFAESDFYGSVGYGSQSASREQLNYATSLGRYSSTSYGSGQSVDLMLGMQFGANENVFVELSSNKLLLDKIVSDFSRFEPVACPAVVGVICPQYTNSTLNRKVGNIDLVVGWNFKPKEDWLLRPYLGARQLSLGNFQINQYDAPLGGNQLSSYDTYDTRFKSIGLIAGLEIQKNAGQWSYVGDVSFSGVKGTSAIKFSNNYGNTFSPAVTKQEISINQWQTRVAIGRQFQVSENADLSVSLGYRIASNNVRIKPKGFDVTIGWDF